MGPFAPGPLEADDRYALLLTVILAASVIAISCVQLLHQLNHYSSQDIETIEGLLYFDSAGSLSMLRARACGHTARLSTVCHVEERLAIR